MWLLFRMTLNTLKHRDISEIDRMSKRFIAFVATFALPIGQPTEINRMPKVYCLWHRQRPCRVGHHCVTDVTVVANHLTRVANVLAIVTAKAA